MKLPFDLGVKLVFRLLLPGFFIAMGMAPILYALLDVIGWRESREYAFILLVFLMGWGLIILDQPIYMLFEGRRYWPDFLKKLFIWREKKRLGDNLKREDKYANTNIQKSREASVEVRRFPLDSKGEREVQRPSRLGNLIKAFETHPDRIYGMDAAFYWYRIWIILDKELREELDNRQAVADSAIYTSCAFYVNAFLWMIYAFLSSIGLLLVKNPFRASSSWLLAFIFLWVGYRVYRMSIYPQTQYGEVFKSIFDIYEDKIDVRKTLLEAATLTSDSTMMYLDRKQKLRIAWRYLHNFMVKCPLCGDVIPPPAYKDHVHKFHEYGPWQPSK